MRKYLRLLCLLCALMISVFSMSTALAAPAVEDRGMDRVEVFDGFIGVTNNRRGIQEMNTGKDVGFRPGCRYSG